MHSGRFSGRQPKLLKRAKTRGGGIGYMATAKVSVAMVVLAVAAYFGYRGYLETRVNTPFDQEKVGSDFHVGLNLFIQFFERCLRERIVLTFFYSRW